MIVKKTLFGVLAPLLALATATLGLAAVPCDDDDDCFGDEACVGGACVPGVLSPDSYAIEAGDRWSSYVWTVQLPALFDPPEQCCFDYTGDGQPDDAFGSVLALLTSTTGGDPAGLIRQAVENGELVKVLDWRELAPDLASGDVQVSVFDGEWNDMIPFADRTAGLGHTLLERSSFGTHGALDQLNTGTVSTGDIQVAGNGLTMLQTFIVSGELQPVRLREPRLAGPVAYDGTPGASCWGLCTVDEDRGPSHMPQIVGGAKVGGVLPAETLLDQMDVFYRGCTCAGVNPDLPVIVWNENTTLGVFEIACTDNTGDPSLCPPDDPCAELDMVCQFLPVMANTFDVDLNDNSIEDSYSVGLRFGFAGNTIDGVTGVIFMDGFEAGDTTAWSTTVS